jgi:hypothetical protein
MEGINSSILPCFHPSNPILPFFRASILPSLFLQPYHFQSSAEIKFFCVAFCVAFVAPPVGVAPPVESAKLGFLPFGVSARQL